MKHTSTLLKTILVVLVLTNTITTVAQTATPTYGALAIDRSNGFYYGWAYDQNTLYDAEKRALDECKQRGGDCNVVLAWSGAGCGAYRTIDGNVGTAYGWGVATTKEAADAIATRECLERSNGKPAVNYVWSCNSGKAPFEELVNNNAPLPANTSSTPSLDYITFNGTKTPASGSCLENAVAVTTADDETVMVMFNNAPSSGTTSVNSSFFTEGCSTCFAVSVQDMTASLTYVAVSGTYTKSGNQVNFNFQVQELNALIEGSGDSVTVSGMFMCEE